MLHFGCNLENSSGCLQLSTQLLLKRCKSISLAGLQDLDLCRCCNLNHNGVSRVADLTWLTCLELAGCKLTHGDGAAEILFGGGVSEATQLRREAVIKLLTQLKGEL